jgi:hypothetical protein
MRRGYQVRPARGSVDRFSVRWVESKRTARSAGALAANRRPDLGPSNSQKKTFCHLPSASFRSLKTGMW